MLLDEYSIASIAAVVLLCISKNMKIRSGQLASIAYLTQDPSIRRPKICEGEDAQSPLLGDAVRSIPIAVQ